MLPPPPGAPRSPRSAPTRATRTLRSAHFEKETRQSGHWLPVKVFLLGRGKWLLLVHRLLKTLVGTAIFSGLHYTFFTVWATTFRCRRNHCCVSFFNDNEENLSLQFPCFHFCSLIQRRIIDQRSKQATKKLNTLSEKRSIQPSVYSLFSKNMIFFSPW